MRTNIVLNDSLVREAMRYSRARTKRELVDEALAAFVKLRAAEAGRSGYRDKVRSLDERLRGLSLRERPSAVLRADRDRA